MSAAEAPSSNCYLPWMFRVATRRRKPVRKAPAASAPAVMAGSLAGCRLCSGWGGGGNEGGREEKREDDFSFFPFLW